MKRPLAAAFGSACLPAFVAMLMLLPSTAPAQISKYMRTTNFSYFEYYESAARVTGPRTNHLKSQLTGAEGRYAPPDDIVSITRARFEHYAQDGRGTNLVAHSPMCLFDRSARELFSTNSLRVFANDGQLYLEGDSGFLYQMTNSTFFISNRVRTVIHQNLMQPVARSRP